MGGIGTQEIFILLLLALVFFGSKKLPEIARGLGKGMAEFRKAARDVQFEITREIERASTDDSKKEPLPPKSQELTDKNSETAGSDEDEGTVPEGDRTGNNG
ncbi:MAG: twin-arginine translocase TatA/TatE family subunit [Candidatus Latescibacteria bacterium]|nr:twin-arginine translocase TatA/TatE family subunit [Candidatus Latescibacterota bacterium]